MNVKEISIKSYLASRGVFPQKQYRGYDLYLSPLRAEATPSFKVQANLWFDFGANVGGSVVDLVMQMEHCDMPTAFARLRANSYDQSTTEPQIASKSSIRITSVNKIENKHLIAYLHERCIPIELARRFCTETHYEINGKPYYAIGFGNELSNKYFKGCTRKEATVFDNGSNECLVFEGFFSFLSYIVLYGETKNNIVVLNSVHNLCRAADFLKGHRIVRCCLDNDEAGQNCFAAITSMGIEAIDRSKEYANHNDLNDYLCAISKKCCEGPRNLIFKSHFVNEKE